MREWDAASSHPPSCEQVLLAERLSKLLPAVTFVSCHPGWADTPAVEAAYGAAKRLLAPRGATW